MFPILIIFFSFAKTEKDVLDTYTRSWEPLVSCLVGLPWGMQSLLSCQPNVCVCMCVGQEERERTRERERASEEIGGSILSRQEVCYSQREREQDTQLRVERVKVIDWERQRVKRRKGWSKSGEGKDGGEMDGQWKSNREKDTGMEIGKENRCGRW